MEPEATSNKKVDNSGMPEIKEVKVGKEKKGVFGKMSDAVKGILPQKHEHSEVKEVKIAHREEFKITNQNQEAEMHEMETQQKIKQQVGDHPKPRRSTSVREFRKSVHLGHKEMTPEPTEEKRLSAEEPLQDKRPSRMEHWGRRLSMKENVGHVKGPKTEGPKTMNVRAERHGSEKKAEISNVTNSNVTNIENTGIPKFVTTANANKLMARITTDLNAALVEARNGKIDESLEGPFRQVGDRNVIAALLNQLEDPATDISETKGLSIKDLCSACKDVIKQLDIIDGDQKKAYLADSTDQEAYMDALARSFEGLDKEKREVLKNLCVICEILSANSDITLMTRSNCAIAPGPAVYKPDADMMKNMAELSPAQKAFEILLANHERILPTLNNAI